ncbi:MAG: hypothetical protein JWO62_227 [Acidimicrobiaceae bacterium]|nr:hypothetical protein [Acidimicrobiaceae bacterium]
MANTLAFYANHVATQSNAHRPRIRSLGDDDLSDLELATSLKAWTVILRDVLAAAPSGMRAWHPAGMTDREGFLALALDELLVHGNDVAKAHGEALEPDPGLCERLLARLFPHVKGVAPDETAWELLLWANGRTVNSFRPLLESWHSHPSPFTNSAEF